MIRALALSPIATVGFALSALADNSPEFNSAQTAAFSADSPRQLMDDTRARSRRRLRRLRGHFEGSRDERHRRQLGRRDAVHEMKRRPPAPPPRVVHGGQIVQNE